MRLIEAELSDPIYVTDTIGLPMFTSKNHRVGLEVTES